MLPLAPLSLKVKATRHLTRSLRQTSVAQIPFLANDRGKPIITSENMTNTLKPLKQTIDDRVNSSRFTVLHVMRLDIKFHGCTISVSNPWDGLVCPVLVSASKSNYNLFHSYKKYSKNHLKRSPSEIIETVSSRPSRSSHPFSLHCNFVNFYFLNIFIIWNTQILHLECWYPTCQVSWPFYVSLPENPCP